MSVDSELVGERNQIFMTTLYG